MRGLMILLKFLKDQHFHPLKLAEFYEFINTGRLTQGKRGTNYL